MACHRIKFNTILFTPTATLLDHRSYKLSKPHLRIEVIPTSDNYNISKIKISYFDPTDKHSKFNDVLSAKFITKSINDTYSSDNLSTRLSHYISSLSHEDISIITHEYSKYKMTIFEGFITGIASYLTFLLLIEHNIFSQQMLFNITNPNSSISTSINKKMFKYLSLPLSALTKTSTGILNQITSFIFTFINIWEPAVVNGKNIDTFYETKLCMEVITGLANNISCKLSKINKSPTSNINSTLEEFKSEIIQYIDHKISPGIITDSSIPPLSDISIPSCSDPSHLPFTKDHRRIKTNESTISSNLSHQPASREHRRLKTNRSTTSSQYSIPISSNSSNVSHQPASREHRRLKTNIHQRQTDSSQQPIPISESIPREHRRLKTNIHQRQSDSSQQPIPISGSIPREHRRLKTNIHTDLSCQPIPIYASSNESYDSTMKSNLSFNNQQSTELGPSKSKIRHKLLLNNNLQQNSQSRQPISTNSYEPRIRSKLINNNMSLLSDMKDILASSSDEESTKRKIQHIPLSSNSSKRKVLSNKSVKVHDNNVKIPLGTSDASSVINFDDVNALDIVVNQQPYYDVGTKIEHYKYSEPNEHSLTPINDKSFGGFNYRPILNLNSGK